MFTVIIPLYNKANYIEKALKSIFEQTFRDFEIIVINDGSTDNSLDVLNSVLNQLKTIDGELFNKTTIINQDNRGVSTARNNGVKNAKNDYIAFLDADDWWEPTFLDEMNKMIMQFPTAGIWSSSYYVVKNKNRRLVRAGVEPGFESGIINYFKVYAKTLEMPVWTGATIVKKKVFDDENGFKKTLSLGEDFDLWVRIALKYEVAFLNKPLSNYNFDVETNAKAVYGDVIYPPEKHYIFNIDYLSETEFKNSDLKQLLDALRLYCLLRYRIKKVYIKEYKKEIKKVDFTRQPLKIRLEYTLPVFLLVFWNYFKVIAFNMISRK